MRSSRAKSTSSMLQLTRALDRLTRAASPEQVVRARAEALLAYLASVPVAVLVANNRARYVDANQHAVALTGYARHELTGMELSELTPGGNQSVGRRLWKAFLRRGRMAGRYELRRKDGVVVAAEYLAIAHVLPGLHVSALVPIGKPGGRRASGSPASGTARRAQRKARRPKRR